ncbi:hypothetical protein D5S18_23700 [Nocardia panacis]|uniref:Uncharacterized protein n=1 Tax=Nocardia panacis TaxID=2340916 RepID=A0A3A4K2P1_9NOCA|nr:hypothetical protein [Nocardia panacis]RJO72174.1 hypothetical protein D5S18_23700 [Nocardia panacis]
MTDTTHHRITRLEASMFRTQNELHALKSVVAHLGQDRTEQHTAALAEFGNLRERISGLDARFDAVDAKMDQILNTLSGNVTHEVHE